MIEATIGWASGNWRAAAASGTPWRRAHGLDFPDAVHLFRRGVPVVVLRAGRRTGCSDPRVEHPAHHHADAEALTVGKLRLQHILLHQRVPERHQKEVQRERIEEAGHHSEFVDPGADAAHQPVRAQLVERSPTRGEELGEIGRDLRFGGVKPEVEIVNQEKVDAVHPEPHLRLLVRPHDPVVAVVVHEIEMEPARPGLGLERVRLRRREKPASDFARQDKFRPPLRVEEAPATNFGEAPAVIWRRVVIAYARIPGSLQRGGGGCFVDPDEELAQRGAAEAELRELHARVSKLSGFRRIHKRQPPLSLSGASSPSSSPQHFGPSLAAMMAPVEKPFQIKDQPASGASL